MNDTIACIKLNRHILNQVTNAVVVVNQSGHIEFINTMAERILNQTFSNCAGVHITEIYRDSKLPEIIATKKEEHNARIIVNQHHCVVTRLPIIRRDVVVGALAIFTDTTALDQLNEALTIEKSELSILKMILEIAYDGIVVIDVEGRISMISNAYKQFLGLEDEDLIGKHISNVIENTRMHIVLKTGVPEINQLQLIKGNYMVATRIPYYVGGKIAGAVGKVIFRNVSEVNDIYEKQQALESELSQYKSEFYNMYRAKYDLDQIISHDARINHIKSNVQKIATSNANVLLQGESGTGKELFAHAIHAVSNRNHHPFVVMNCAAIPENLLEAELFGYEDGAFTGASKGGRMGKFELANYGTIFLDEIGDMPLTMQAKILRVLQEREIEPLGGNRPKRIDVRLIAASNKDLAAMCQDGEFREDLYYRLNVFKLDIPPLRERKDDIKLIANHLIEAFNKTTHRQIKGISDHTLQLFYNYHWPGNVRELRNLLERAYLIVEGEDYIQPWHLPNSLKPNQNADLVPLKQIMNAQEKKVIMERLVTFNGNKSRAAKSLGISRVTFHKKLEKHQLISS